MDNFTLALNYNTLFLTLGKSDRYVWDLFSQCQDYSEEDYAALCGVGQDVIRDNRETVLRCFDALPRDTRILKSGDALFPPEADDVPFLYTRGDTALLATDGVSIVGTRRPSERGKELARQAATQLGNYGYTIVSGLALGIDGVAHIQALSDEKPTIAVIGTAIDQYYPAEHEKLQNLIAQNGLVVSMFHPCVKTQKYYFMQRNLLMSHISCASLVVESSEGGGGVAQAKYTEKQGKKVLIFKEVYENRTYLWPRNFANPVIVEKPENLPGALKTSAVAGKKKKSVEEELGPGLFDLF